MHNIRGGEGGKKLDASATQSISSSAGEAAKKEEEEANTL